MILNFSIKIEHRLQIDLYFIVKIAYPDVKERGIKGVRFEGLEH